MTSCRNGLTFVLDLRNTKHIVLSMVKKWNSLLPVLQGGVLYMLIIIGTIKQ